MLTGNITRYVAVPYYDAPRYYTDRIFSVQLPNLTSIEQISVNSDADIDCKSFQQTIMTATNKSESSVTCSTSYANSGSHFSHLHLGAKVVFGVFVGIFVEFAML